MPIVRHKGHKARQTARRTGLSAALVLIALSGGCTVIQGDTASLDSMKTASATASPSVAAAPTDNDALTTGSLAEANIASAGIPIPLMSPRNRNVKVASIDPRAGLSAISRGMPLNKLAGVYYRFDKAVDNAEASKLNTPKEIRRVLKTLRIQEPETLADGWYAVQAMAAANNAVFAQGVRDEVRVHGEAQMLASLQNTNYVMHLPGALSAISSVMASAKSEDERLIKLRKRFIDTAFRFQKQKWGMITPLQMSTPVEVATTEPISTQMGQLLADLSPISEAHAYSLSVMSKILAQGAREVISAPIVPISGGKDETSSCLNWARLNLNQCVAAAHFPSEEAWCVGTHAIEEVRTCWATALPSPGVTPQ